MLRKVWLKRAVRSDEGFEVRFLGLRKGIEYREGSAVFGLEVERHPDGWVVYAKSLKSLKPNSVALSVDRGKQICIRIKDALRFLKINIAMDDYEPPSKP